MIPGLRSLSRAANRSRPKLFKVSSALLEKVELLIRWGRVGRSCLGGALTSEAGSPPGAGEGVF